MRDILPAIRCAFHADGCRNYEKGARAPGHRLHETSGFAEQGLGVVWLNAGERVKCRTDYFEGLHVRLSVENFFKNLDYLGIAAGAEELGIVFVVPEAEGGDLTPVGECERNQIQKSFLAAQPREDFALHEIREFIETVGLEAHRNLASKHVDLRQVGIAACEEPFRATHCTG